MKNPTSLLLATSALLSAFGNVSAQESLVYSERFINLAGENAELANVGWKAYVNGIAPAADGAIGLPAGPIGSVSGQMQAGLSGGIGAELTFDDDDFGFIYLYMHDTGPVNVLVFEESEIDRDAQEITRIKFVLRDRAEVQHRGHVAVRVADQWYVNTQLFETELTDSIQYNMREFTWTNENWKEVIFNLADNSVMAISGEPAGTLPAGDLEAVGFWFIHPGSASSSAVLDEYSVYATAAQAQEWYGYPVDENGWANTESWMGWVYVGQDPNIWVQNLAKYIYVPNDSGWTYIYK